MYCINVCSMNQLYCNELISLYEGTHQKKMTGSSPKKCGGYQVKSGTNLVSTCYL